MTYDDKETSVEDGSPTEVYTITAGSTVYRLTSDEISVDVGADTFTPVAGLRRSAVGGGGDTGNTSFWFEMPTSQTLAQLFVGIPRSVRYRVQADRFHRTDLPTPQVVRFFDGYIDSVSFPGNGAVARFNASPVIASLRRQIPRRKFQSLCNWVLYDSGTCKVDDTDIAFRASLVSVSSQSGNTLTVSGLSGGYPDGWFTGGYVEAAGGGDYRRIISHVGNVLELQLAFGSVPSQVNVFAGCDHSAGTCASKFANLVNYGGFPFVPTKNPFSSGIA